MGDKINDVNKFWDRFRDLIIQSGVSDSYADWYVRWGRKFALSIKGRPLRQRTTKDIQRFLVNISNKKGVQEWQIEQAREALMLLYNVYLKLPIQILEIPALDPLKNNHKSAETNGNFRDTFAHKDEIL